MDSKLCQNLCYRICWYASTNKRKYFVTVHISIDRFSKFDINQYVLCHLGDVELLEKSIRLSSLLYMY